LQEVRTGGSRGISFDPITGGYRRTISHDAAAKRVSAKPISKSNRKVKEVESKHSTMPNKTEMMTMSAKRAD
jgi:hypothetical protein